MPIPTKNLLTPITSPYVCGVSFTFVCCAIINAGVVLPHIWVQTSPAFLLYKGMKSIA